MNKKIKPEALKYIKGLQFDRWPIEDAILYLSGCEDQENTLNQQLSIEHYTELLEKSDLYKYYGSEPSPFQVIEWAKRKRIPIHENLQIAIDVVGSDWMAEYLESDLWLVQDAVSLVLGIDPQSEKSKGAQIEIEKYVKIAKLSIKAKKLDAKKEKDPMPFSFDDEFQYFINPDEFLKWAYEKKIIRNEFLIEKAKKLLQEAPSDKKTKLTPNQIDKHLVQAVASCLWDQDPKMTIADVKKHKWILSYANGNLYKGKNTLQKWLSEVDPRKKEEKLGRPKSKQHPV